MEWGQILAGVLLWISTLVHKTRLLKLDFLCQIIVMKRFFVYY